MQLFKRTPDLKAADWQADKNVVKFSALVADLERKLPDLQRSAEMADAEAAPLSTTVEELDALSDAGRDVSERGDLSALRQQLKAARQRAIVARVDARDCAVELDTARVQLASAQHVAREKSRQALSASILADLEALGNSLVGAGQIVARLRATVDLADGSLGHDDLSGILPGFRDLGEVRHLWTELLLPGQTAINGMNESQLGTFLMLLERFGITAPLAEARKLGAPVPA